MSLSLKVNNKERNIGLLSRMQNFGNLILVFCILLGIAVMFAIDNYGGFWEDEIFQTLSVRNYMEAPLGLLTFYIGHVWTEIFGFTMLSLRYLTSIETTLAICVTTVFLFGLTGNKLLTAFTFLVACILTKLSAFPLYNWDSGSYLFDALSVCLLISVLTKPSNWKYLWLGFSIGLMTLGRAPSGLFLPLSMLMVVLASRLNEKRYKPLRGTIIIFAGWLAAMLLFTTIVLSIPTKYVELLTGGNVISGHSPLKDWGYLFERLLGIIKKTTWTWFPGVGCMLLAVIMPKIKRKRNQFWILSIWVLFCLILSYNLVKFDLDIPLILGGDASVGLGFLLVYPLYYLFNHGKRDKLLTICLWSVLCLYISMMCGSDAYIERIETGFTIPLIIGLLWKTGIKGIRSYIKYALGCLMIVFGLMLCNYMINMVVRMNKIGEVRIEIPFAGIHTERESWWLDEINNVDQAIPYLQENNVRFAYFGHHFLIELFYGKNEGLPFQEYQQRLEWEEGWGPYKQQVLKNVDAFVHKDRRAPYFHKVIKPEIESLGFTDSVKMGDATIFFREGYRSSHRLEP